MALFRALVLHSAHNCAHTLNTHTRTHLQTYRESWRSLRRASFLFSVLQLGSVTEQQNKIPSHCPCLRPLSSTLNTLPSLCFSPLCRISLPPFFFFLLSTLCLSAHSLSLATSHCLKHSSDMRLDFKPQPTQAIPLAKTEHTHQALFPCTLPLLAGQQKPAESMDCLTG